MDDCTLANLASSHNTGSLWRVPPPGQQPSQHPFFCNINPWLPHSYRFNWDYVAAQATLWLDICKQFTKEHFREWEAQKSQPCQLGALEHDTKIIYHWHLTKRQAEIEAAEGREAAAKQLPPEWQAAHVERQVWAMSVKMDVMPVQLESSLYPNWTWKQDTRPKGSDLPRPYKTPKEGNREELTLEEELDTKSMFDPLASGSQSSQPLNSQSSTAPDTTTEVARPKTLPHFCEAPISVPPFDLALIGMLAEMSPWLKEKKSSWTWCLGSPFSNMAAAGAGRGTRGSGWSSYSDSPMSLGSPAISSSIGIALRIHAWPVMPAQFDCKGSSEEEEDDREEEMDSAIGSARVEEDWMLGTDHHSQHLKLWCSHSQHALFGAPPCYSAHFLLIDSQYIVC